MKARSTTLIGLVAVAVLLLGTATAAGDTFLLKDGGRLHGELDTEFQGPDKKSWLRISTQFGSVELRKAALKRRLKVDRPPGPLRVERVVVSTLKGDVEKSTDGKNWNRIAPRERAERATGRPRINVPNGLVAPGDSLRTGADGEIDLDVGWGVIHVASDSAVELVAKDAAASMGSLRVLRGAMGARVTPPKDAEFRVETPQASMGVRGTTFVVRVGDGTRCAVEEGAVEVGRGTLGGRVVQAGGALRVAPDGAVVPVEQDGGEQATFERLRHTYSVPRFERALIVGGTFVYPPVGPPYNTGEQAGADWKPAKISVPAFEMSKYEVTNAQYQIWLDWMAKHEDHSLCHPWEPKDWKHRRNALTVGTKEMWFPGAFQEDDQPAVYERWFDAYAFCAWVGGRLPSDGQFTWAEVSGDPRPKPSKPWGKELLQYAWLRDNAAEPDYTGPGSDGPPQTGPIAQFADMATNRLRTHPVGTRKPDDNGIYDLWGNVDEWVHDMATLSNATVPPDGGPRPDVRPAPDAPRRVQVGGQVRRWQRGGGIRVAVDWMARHHQGTRSSWMDPYASTGFRPVWDVLR